MREDFHGLRIEVKELRGEVVGLRKDFEGLRGEIQMEHGLLRKEFEGLRRDFVALDKNVSESLAEQVGSAGRSGELFIESRIRTRRNQQNSFVQARRWRSGQDCLD